MLILLIALFGGLEGVKAQGFDLQDFVAESSFVVDGKVTGKTPLYGLDGLIYTKYDFHIYSIYKGDEHLKEVSFISLGGTMEDEALVVCPSLHFDIGEEGIIGLRAHAHDWIDGATMMPVSADYSWIGIDRMSKRAEDFLGRIHQLDNLNKFIEEVSGNKVLKVDAPGVSEDIPEVMITINSISPLITQAGRGQVVTVKGSGFGATRGGVGAVLFRDVHYPSTSITRPAVQYVSWSDTEIKAIVPYNAGSGAVKVQNNSGGLSPASSQTLSITYNVANINLSELVYHIDHNQDADGGYDFVYSTSTANSGVDITSIPAAVAAVERATSTWNGGTEFTIFSEEACGRTSAQTPVRDGRNLISFDNAVYDLDIRRGSSVLAALFSFYSRCSSEWEVVEFDLIIKRDGNPNGTGGSVDWEYGPGAPSRGEADFESVVLHELGHAHQLGHCRVSGAVMYPIIQLGTTVRNLASSERNGGGYVQGKSKAYSPPVNRFCPAPFNTSRQYFDYNAGNRCSVVLPLELIGFKAKVVDGNNVKLAWTTRNELNHNYIKPQYQKIGHRDWQSLPRHPGTGDADQVSDYEYIHEDLKPGIYMYRLAQVGVDGQVEYSESISVDIPQLILYNQGDPCVVEHGIETMS